MLYNLTWHPFRRALSYLLIVMMIISTPLASAKSKEVVDSQYGLDVVFSKTLSLDADHFILPESTERERVTANAITDILNTAKDKNTIRTLSEALKSNRIYFAVEGTSRSEYAFMDLPFLVIYFFGNKDLIRVMSTIRSFDVPGTDMDAQYGVNYNIPVNDWLKAMDFVAVSANKILAVLKLDEPELHAKLTDMIASLPKYNRRITIESDDPVLYDKKTVKLTASIERHAFEAPAKTSLVWTSSDPRIAKVDSAGKITAVSPGKVTIVCSAKDNKSIQDSVDIEVRASVKAVKLLQPKVALLIGANPELAQKTLEYTISPANAYTQTVSWSSSDESVVTVEDGIITAVGLGKASISLKSDDPMYKTTATCAATVTQAIATIVLAPIEDSIVIGKQVKLKASITPENAHNKKLKWSSSDTSIATVSQTGTVTTRKAGDVTITCMSSDGSEVFAEIKLTIIKKAQ